MRVLVTRPRDDAADTAQKLMARGHTALIAPLIEIRFRDGPEIPLDGVQAVLATSSNGVHALARRTQRRNISVFAVGLQTARAARDAGFEIVKSADGNAQTLAAATLRWAKPGDGALLHAAGAETKGLLAEKLAGEGYQVRTSILYDAVAVPELPPAVRSALEADAIDAVLYFSPRSARIFSDCVVKARLAGKCRNLFAYCISRAAADALAPLILRSVHVAERPDQEALLALLA